MIRRLMTYKNRSRLAAPHCVYVNPKSDQTIDYNVLCAPGTFTLSNFGSTSFNYEFDTLLRFMVVEGGQSNMEGRDGDVTNPDYPFTTNKGIFYNGSENENISTLRGGAEIGSHANYFAEKFYQLTNTKVVMVERAVGGTGLTPTASTSNWSDSGTLRSGLVTITNAALEANGLDTPIAMLWCQGERDAQEMDSNSSYTKANVKVAMQDLIDWWFGVYPNSYFVISELGDKDTQPNTQGWKDMRAVQNEVAEENERVFIGFSGAKDFGAAKMVDTLHYNYIGYKEMGENLAITLKNLIYDNN